jgi:alanine dehydrogenase
MKVIGAKAIESLVSIVELVAALKSAFREKFSVPNRHIARLTSSIDGPLLLTMPAFREGQGGIVKLVTVNPQNPHRGLPAIQAVVVVFSSVGTPIALLDGTILTRLRTSAASALASQYLSRENSAHLVLLGTGELAPHMARAHCAVRPIRKVSIWGRNQRRAASTALAIRALIDRGIDITVSESAQESVSTADIVCCATSSAKPILEGRWLRPGTFIDLVGSFSPSNRETDDDVVRLSRIFVDTRDGAFAEAGDILDPLSRGVISRDCVAGDLSDLVCGRITGRTSAEEITLFKSVGTSIEDFVAAQLVLAAARHHEPRRPAPE